MKIFKHLGPATMVTAAFIGPGTIITASISGASYGYCLLWALLFSIISTIILQEMTARLGLVRGKGLASIIREDVSNKYLLILLSAIIIVAIWIGNAAYQSGNIVGATIGIREVFGFEEEWAKIIYILSTGIIVFIILFLGKYKVIEGFLILLVSFMSLLFVLALFFVPLDLAALFKGLFIPQIPEGALFSVIALVGTTIVPYNLFLHSSAVAKKWTGIENLKNARKDIILSIGIGGIISMCILITSAATLNIQGSQVDSISDLAPQLRSLLGQNATVLISLGIFAAGITSSITAPLAAAFTVSEILGKSSDLNSKVFRLTWISVLLTGVIVATLDLKPLMIIQTAQFANGLLLPIIGIILLYIMNSKLLGKFKNHVGSNILGALIVLIIIGLGLKSIFNVMGII